MLYPVTTDIYIQTEQILKMTQSTLAIVMADNAATSYTVSAAKFADLLAIVNKQSNP